MIRTEHKLPEKALRSVRPSEREIIEQLMSYRKVELIARLNKIKIDKS